MSLLTAREKSDQDQINLVDESQVEKSDLSRNSTLYYFLF